jgi:cytochrome c oxidase subunit 1
MMSYWVFFCGGVVMLTSFLLPGGAAQSGWTSYPPLSVVAPVGQTAWIIGMLFLIFSSLLGAVNFIVTILHLRAPGLSMFRLPFFVWAQLVTSFLLLLAFPPLQAAGTMQFMDRVAHTSFFMPTGLVVGGKVAPEYTGGGNPLLWQHLFWFLAHPEVYVLILPALGIVAEVIANNTRKPLWGYRSMVYSLIFLGFMSFVVWAHHMFMTGMGTAMSTFFQTTTMIISIPSVVILTALILSLWGGSIRFTIPMLFALAFLPMFGIGGLTGSAARTRVTGHPPARHVLRHRPLPLRGCAGDDLRDVRRHLLLVPESHRQNVERGARQISLLRLVRRDQRRVHADVLARAWPAFRAASMTRRSTRTARRYSRSRFCLRRARGCSDSLSSSSS